MKKDLALIFFCILFPLKILTAQEFITDSAPMWSPDGEKLVFTSNRAGNFDIFIVSKDGSGLRNLTNDPAVDIYPAFSPDGKNIVFASDRDGNYEIYTMQTDGGGVERVTNMEETREDRPQYTPVGKAFYFNSTKIRDEDGKQVLYDSNVFKMDLNGDNLEQLTRSDKGDSFGTFSADGSVFLFGSNRDGSWELFLEFVGSGKAEKIRTAPFDNYSIWPSFSPDGKVFAYQSAKEGNGELYLVAMDDLENEINLTNTPGLNEIHPAFSPNGETIAFAIYTDPGNRLLYLMDKDGGNITQVTFPPEGKD